MSRIVEFAKAGGPEVLEFKDIEVPTPADDEVRIRVKAIGLNRAEAMWREDAYIEPVKFPARLGYEAVGIVDAVGRNATEVAVGDAVNTIPSFSMNQYGMYGDVVLAPSYAIVKHPPSLSYEQAASIWMMFVTAYGALIEDAKLTAEDAVIIPPRPAALLLQPSRSPTSSGRRQSRLPAPAPSASNCSTRAPSTSSPPRNRISSPK